MNAYSSDLYLDARTPVEVKTARPLRQRNGEIARFIGVALTSPIWIFLILVVIAFLLPILVIWSAVRLFELPFVLAKYGMTGKWTWWI